MSSQIKSVRFGLIKDEQVDQLSFIEVNKSIEQDLSQIDHTVVDLSLGSDSPQKYCKTCTLEGGKCMGHEGHMILALPILKPALRNLFRHVISGFCTNCKTLSLKKTVCETCKSVVKYSFMTPYIVRVNGEILPMYQLYQLFKQASLQPYEPLKGYKLTAKDFFVTKLIVPSVTIRPEIFYKGKRGTDDLTRKLQSIIQTNEKLKKILSSDHIEKVKLQVYHLLAYQIYTYYDNKIAGLPVSTDLTGKITKSLMDSIESKEGLLRSNLRGKRTEHSSRCVITPDSTLGLDQVGVPLKVAKKLTYPVTVSRFNIDQVRQWIGSDQYPYVEYYQYKKDDQDYYKLRVLDSNKETILQRLKQGDIVHRSLMTGDYVGVNRQPTIHRYGFMGHRVVVYEDSVNQGLTLKLNPSTCKPYNADFDGDQMTIHVPQTKDSQMDVSNLMGVDKNYVDNKNRAPIFGVTKQLLTGAYYLSKRNPQFTRAQAIKFLGQYFILDSQKQKYSGRDLISMCLIKGFNFKEPSTSVDPIVIEDGVFKSGVFTKNNFSFNSKFAQQLVVYAGKQFWSILNKFLYLFRNYYRSLKTSISYANYNLKKEEVDRLNQIKKKYLTSTDNLREKSKEYQAQSYTFLQKAFLSKGENHSLDMARAGSSGSMTNLIQILNIIGLRTIQGLTPRQYFKDLYPTFTGSALKGQLYKEGLIWSNYRQGMPLLDFLNDAAYARDSTIVNQLKVTTMGYFSRRALCSLSDLYIDKDYLVKDGRDKIVQFAFGGNNLDLDQFKPKVENLDLEKKFAQRYFAKGPSDPVPNLKQYVEKYYDKMYYEIISTNLKSDKLTYGQVDQCIKYMQIPPGTPVGVATGHAITEPCTQLTLSAKHNLSGEQSTFDRLLPLIDRSYTEPRVEIVTDNQKVLEQICAKILPRTLADKYSLKYHLDKHQVVIVAQQMKSYLKEKVQLTLKSRYKGTYVLNQTEEGLVISPDVKTLEQIDSIYSLVKDIIIQGVRAIKKYLLFKGQNKLILWGSKGSFTLYNTVMDLVNKNLLKQEYVVFTDPVYYEAKKGIEAARKLLYTQLTRFLAEGINIDPRYFSLFCDLVSRQGKLESTNREGLMKTKPPLTRAAYEATKSVVVKLAITEEKDTLTSPISAIILGKPLALGVNYPKIYY